MFIVKLQPTDRVLLAGAAGPGVVGVPASINLDADKDYQMRVIGGPVAIVAGGSAPTVNDTKVAQDECFCFDTRNILDVRVAAATTVDSFASFHEIVDRR